MFGEGWQSYSASRSPASPGWSAPSVNKVRPLLPPSRDGFFRHWSRQDDSLVRLSRSVKVSTTLARSEVVLSGFCDSTHRPIAKIEGRIAHLCRRMLSGGFFFAVRNRKGSGLWWAGIAYISNTSVSAKRLMSRFATCSSQNTGLLTSRKNAAYSATTIPTAAILITSLPPPPKNLQR